MSLASRPASCKLYESSKIAAVSGRHIEVAFKGVRKSFVAKDVQPRDEAEYLIAVNVRGGELVVRLDEIEATTGTSPPNCT